MKKLISLLMVVSIMSFASNFAFGETNNSTTNIVENYHSTNLNQVMIEILSGVKDAGKEFYGVSKDAIHTSVDFIGKQAPDIFHQFIVFHLAETILYFIVFVLFAIIPFVVSRKLGKSMEGQRIKKEYDEELSPYNVYLIWKWITMCLAAVLIIIGIASMGPDILKLTMAPKIYVIEYTVEMIKSNH